MIMHNFRSVLNGIEMTIDEDSTNSPLGHANTYLSTPEVNQFIKPVSLEDKDDTEEEKMTPAKRSKKSSVIVELS